MTNLQGVSMKTAECQFCCDTGWTGWEKPMTSLDERIQMVFVPQVCACKAGDNFRNQQFVVQGTLKLAAICPDCQGCGRVSFDFFGRPHPQPTWTSNSTADDPNWLRCRKCAGIGMVDNGKSPNELESC